MDFAFKFKCLINKCENGACRNKKIPVEELIEQLKTDGVEISVEEAIQILEFLYFIANLAMDENFDIEILPVA
ncbi:hypothetical protein BOQ60_09045 [Chryseobacterium sp. CH1]|nr:hypothetical protein BOQ60_09045 [Chryseobacterium sp. CH1]